MADILGTDGDDTIVGTNDADIIRALNGWNNVRGGAGDDRLIGGNGYDSMDGELGSDKLFGGDGGDYLTDHYSGSDQLFGQGGDDYLSISRGVYRNESWVLDGGDGNDSIYASANPMGRITISGGAGNDRISFGATLKATVDAGAGDDTVEVALGGRAQTVTLGSGSDILKPVYSPYIAIPEAVHVVDFDTTQDHVDLSQILTSLVGWDGNTNPFATGHLRFHQSGLDSILQMDQDGGSNNWQSLVIFEDVDAGTIDTGFNAALPFADPPLVG